MTNRFYFIVCVVLAFAVVAWAGPTEDRDNRLWTGQQTFDGVIQEQSDKSDGTSLCFEGTTSDAFETCFLFTDPTADRTITFGDSSFTAGATNAHTAITTITVEDAGTNNVVDLLTTSRTTSGTVASGFGIGIAFDMEDLGGTEEQARIDAVLTTETDGAEDVRIDFSINAAGAITNIFSLRAANDATTSNFVEIRGGTAQLNGIVDVFKLSTIQTAASVAGMGIGTIWEMPDGTGLELEEMATFDVVQTDVAAASNEADVVISIRGGGAATNGVNEVFRLVADAKGTTSGDRMELTSFSAETNAVLYPLVLKQSGGTTVATFGVGIDMQAEFADGVETACTIEAVWTDVGTGSEDADFVINCKDAGTTVELLRATSDGTLTIASGGGFLPPAETVTNTNVILAAECGTTYYLSGDGSFLSTLPAVSTVTSGCEFKFVSKSPPTGADIHSVTTGNSHENLIYGSVVVNGAVVACVAEDVVRFDNGGTVAIGDQIILKSDGAAWYLSGDAVSASSIVCTTT